MSEKYLRGYEVLQLASEGKQNDIIYKLKGFDDRYWDDILDLKLGEILTECTIEDDNYGYSDIVFKLREREKGLLSREEVLALIENGEYIEFKFKNMDTGWKDISFLSKKDIETEMYYFKSIVFRKGDKERKEFVEDYKTVFGHDLDSEDPFENKNSYEYENPIFYKLWKFAKAKEYKNYDTDKKVTWNYKFSKVRPYYDVTREMLEDFGQMVGKNFDSLVHVASKYPHAYFESGSRRIEFTDSYNNHEFDLFIFTVFKYGNLE